MLERVPLLKTNISTATSRTLKSSMTSQASIEERVDEWWSRVRLSLVTSDPYQKDAGWEANLKVMKK